VQGVKLATLSCDAVESHQAWLNDVVAHCENNITIDFPIIADPTREISVKYGMLDPNITVRPFCFCAISSCPCMIVAHHPTMHPCGQLVDFPLPSAAANSTAQSVEMELRCQSDTPCSAVAYMTCNMCPAAGQGRPAADVPRGVYHRPRQEAEAIPQLPCLRRCVSFPWGHAAAD